jgi:hypothetical protein
LSLRALADASVAISCTTARTASSLSAVSPLLVTEGYIREKLRAAADAINSGRGSIHERLLSAWLSFHVLKPADFPKPDDGKLFARIIYRLTDRQAADDEGDVPATIRQMSEDEANDVASDVLEIHARFKRA